MSENDANAAAAVDPAPTTTTEATDAALASALPDDTAVADPNPPAEGDRPSDDSAESEEESQVNPAHEEDDNPEANVGDKAEDNG